MHYLLAGNLKFYPQSDQIDVAGTKKKIEPQVSQLLQLLLQDPQQVCTKEQMLATIWSGRVVTDDSVRALVRKLRDELGDDVKAPVFIKTHPRVGYQLICDIRQQKTAKSFFEVTDRRFISAVVVLFIAIVLLVSFLNLDFHKENQQAENSPLISTLTQLPGSELAPDYSPVTQRLLFSYRDSHDALLSLYVKGLTTDTVQRLSHDDFNYINALWQPDGKGLYFSRFLGQESQHFGAEFEPELGLVNTQPLPEELNNWYLKSTGSDNKLYLVSAQTPRGVAVWDATSEQLQRLTSPERGEGDIHAAPSHDGKQLAIIRALTPEQRQLLVMDLATGTLLFSDDLPIKAYRLIWGSEDQSLLLSAFDGELLSLNLKDKSYHSYDLANQNVNHPFYSCGPSCIFARQHNGNYVDIAEQVSPFAVKNNQALLNISSTGVEDFPQYGKQGTVYFVQQQKDGQWLMEKQRTGAPQKLFLLPAEGQLQALAINDSKTHLAGKLANRIFYFHLEKLHFQWLSPAIDDDFYPHFVQQGEVIRFTRKENGIFQSHFFNVNTRESFSVGEAIQYVWESNASADSPYKLIIDTQNQLLLQEQGKAAKKLLTLPSSSPNRIKVVNDHLYFSHRIGNTAWLSRLSLKDFAIEKRELAKNRLRLHFDISEDSSKILGVNSVLAQSNLVRVELVD